MTVESQSADSPEPIATPRWSKRARACARGAGRLLVIAGLGIFGWYSLEPMFVTLRGPRAVATEDQTEIPDGARASIPALMAQSEDGHWMFSGWNWRIGQRSMDDAQLEAHLGQVARAEAVLTPEPLASEAGLIESLKAFGLIAQPMANGTLHRLDGPNVRARVVSRTIDNRLRLVAGALALRIDPARWKVFEVLPLPRLSASLSADKVHLMPVPDGAHQVCSRWSVDEEMMVECVELDAAPATLLRLWWSAGWKTKTESGRDTFDYVCVRGDQAIRAWAPGGQAKMDALVLFRLQ